MENNIELDGCPHCGGRDLRDSTGILLDNELGSYSENSFFVVCHGCGASGPRIHAKADSATDGAQLESARQAARGAWNVRTLPASELGALNG